MNGNVASSQSVLNTTEIGSSVKFTSREIDIIACIINGRSIKTMASLLSISFKTVENHIRNIMFKVGCNSQEGIRDFIENSKKFFLFRRHYQNLLIQADFKKQLEKISMFIRTKTFTCCLHYGSEQKDSLPLLHEIETHLRQAGVKVVLNQKEDMSFLADLKAEGFLIDHVIYVISETAMKNFHVNNKKRLLLAQNVLQVSNSFTWISLDKNTLEIPQEFREIYHIALSEQKSYYHFVFEILKRLRPESNLDKIIAEFIRNYDPTYNDFSKELPQIHQEEKIGEFTQNLISFTGLPFLKKWKVEVFAILSLSIFCLGLFLKVNKHSEKELPETSVEQIVRADLVIPAHNILLKRPQLMEQIEEKLREQGSIRTVVLVGIGGAGKTTLARQYLKSQRLPIVWEINAETKSSLIGSFENLAYASSKTLEEKKDLASILKVEDSQERTRKIVLFVKKKLREKNNWCLLFDNVESFTDIKEFYPLDTDTWGTGKVIITTRDSNIKNNNHINPHNVIDIKELDGKEKFTLLTDIIFENTFQKLSPSQKKRIEAFLEKIPPFPLDVSTAAYYIKDTKISYEEYVERINAHSVDFEKTQEILLKETNNYTKTRYGIITLTLKNLVGENEDFKELLLLVGLLDSQDIPKNLLTTYKKDTVVEQFIHNFRKQSLIATEASSAIQSFPTFSIHRSTQEISLNYLKNKIISTHYKRILQEIMKTLANYMDNTLNKYDSFRLLLLARHGESFLIHMKILGDVVEKNSDQTIDFLTTLGVVHRLLGRNLERSKELLYEGYQICKELHGEYNAKSGNILVQLGYVHRDLGHYEKAKNLLEKGVGILKRHYGESHVETGWALIYLGYVHRDLGHYEKAKNLLEQGLVILRQHYGEGHVETGRALVYLGSVYRNLGQYEKSKEILEHGLNIIKKHYDENYVMVGCALVYLGNTYEGLGQYEKAKEIFEHGLNIIKKHYGENHLMVGWASIYLGSAYKSLGKYEKAKELLEQGLNIIKTHQDENHMMVGWASIYLGSVYRTLGQYEKAKEILDHGLSIIKKHYGENHMMTGWALLHLGSTYRCLAYHKKAKELLEKGLDIYRSNFGNDHVMTGWALIKVGKIHLSLGDYEKAKVFFEESLKIYRIRYSLNHINLAKVLLSLGQSYILSSELEKAEDFMNQSLQIFTTNNHPEAYLALEALGDLTLTKTTAEKNTKKPKVFRNHAIGYLKQALEAVKAYFPKDSPHSIRIQSRFNVLSGT